MALSAEAFDYKITGAFKHSYYKNLLMKNNIVGKRTCINNEEKQKEFFYILEKDGVNYALPEDIKPYVPLLVTGAVEKDYEGNPIGGKEAYKIIRGFKSARLVPQQYHTFKQLIDEFVPFKHENKAHFTLWKIVFMSAYYGRVNVRISTNAGFGKDSLVNVMRDLMGDTATITNPTFAKLCYLLVANKVVMINEVSDLKADEVRNVQQFFLTAGDFKNDFEKPSMSTDKVPQNIDISKLSILVVYNDMDHYPEGSKYFDKMFSRAVLERFVPLKLTGKILEEFGHKKNPEAMADLYKEDFVRFIKSVEYYKHHWHELVGKRATTAKQLGFNDRYARSIDTVLDFIQLYAGDDEELRQQLVEELLYAHDEYKRMIREEEVYVPNTTFDKFEVREDKL